jgi:hypothetical protein
MDRLEPSPMETEVPGERVRAYAWAVIAVVLCIPIKMLLDRLGQEGTPAAAPLYLAVAWAGYRGGLGPGVLATGLGAVLAAWWLPHNAVGMMRLGIGVLAASLITVGMGEARWWWFRSMRLAAALVGERSAAGQGD